MPEPIVVPKPNENDDEVVVVELADGHVRAGQALYAVETSKATFEIDAEADGFPRWTVAVGDRVAVLARIGWLFATEAERDAWVEEAPREVPAVSDGEGRPATEPARRLAAELGVSLADVPGTGIIREGDVRALAAATAAPATGSVEEEPTVGRLSDALRERIAADGAAVAALPSAEKVALYREHGAVIGERVVIGRGTLIDTRFVEIGDDTSIGEDVLVRSRRFTIGQLGQIGAGCRFFCRDFIAGDVVTLRWNVAVVDGQGGIHDCTIGGLCFIAYDTYLNTDRDVTLGERVCLSPGARIYTHRKWLEALDGYPFSYAPVVIGERSWLGPGSLILPGVVLGAEVTVMANSVVASNAPAGALVGGSPAAIVKRRQKQELDPTHRAALVREIFEGNRAALEVLGWSLAPEAADGAIWAGRLTRDGVEARVVVVASGSAAASASSDGRTIVVAFRDGAAATAGTVFDLETRAVRGERDAAADAIRHLLGKYGHLFEPRLWRHGQRLDETAY